MNREAIIGIAKKVSENGNWKPALGNEFVVDFVERFFTAAYEAGAAAEREACAIAGGAAADAGMDVAAAIRARGQS